jgi:hypothetical protein
MSGKDERASNVKSIRKALGKLTHLIRNSRVCEESKRSEESVNCKIMRPYRSWRVE